ncbi:MAG: TetR/AcrR family transcriptional regulator [Myxococcales bacterium]|nr:TetR/AcrR family transcriptional regulator [Myxococcales bacterium]
MGRPREVSNEQILAAARRCFLARGAGVSAAEIARELGVSHTTLFNRFGSKEGLMLAALGPPAEIAWVAALESGPDERPIRDQLLVHAGAIAAFFQELQAGLAVLQAAGIDGGADPARSDACPVRSAPERAYVALVGWLDRAQQQGRLGRCETSTLASTLLGALQGWAFTARVCGLPSCNAAEADYAERLVALLWTGVGTSGSSDS